MEESGEDFWIARFGKVSLVEGLRHRGHQFRYGEASSFLPARSSADAIRDHRQGREALGMQYPAVCVTDARSVHTHAAREGTQEEVILVVRASLAGVRKPPRIDIRELWPLDLAYFLLRASCSRPSPADTRPVRLAETLDQRRDGEGVVASGEFT